RVGRAESHRLGEDLLDAGARPDRLIIYAVTGLLLIGISPFRVDGKRKGRSRTGDIGRLHRNRKDGRRGGNEAGGGDGLEEIHARSPFALSRAQDAHDTFLDATLAAFTNA